MEHITDADYAHSKRFCKDYKKRDYHDLYVQSDTLLLGDIFENFQNINLDQDYFLSILGLALQTALKKTEVKPDLQLVSTCY